MRLSVTTFPFPFYAMRHGETSWNARGAFQGHTDVPLSPEGIRQVEGNARRLGKHLASAGISPSSIGIVSSPLSRALHSSRIICAELGIAEDRLATDPRLKEASFGHWEGLTTVEVKQRFREERRARKRDRWNFAPPEGQSYADISSAMGDFLEQFRQESGAVLHPQLGGDKGPEGLGDPGKAGSAPAGAGGNGPLLLVTHTGNIRAILRLLLDLKREEAMATQIPHDRLLYWDGAFAKWI
jgi:probable phosphoglycerate mutase